MKHDTAFNGHTYEKGNVSYYPYSSVLNKIGIIMTWEEGHDSVDEFRVSLERNPGACRKSWIACHNYEKYIGRVTCFYFSAKYGLDRMHMRS